MIFDKCIGYTRQYGEVNAYVTQAAIELQNRPLSKQYMIVWMDDIVFKVRDGGKVINKTVYLPVGLDKTGHKEVLGMWVDNAETLSFWMTVLTDMKSRGIEDILITCTDNLNGFTETMRSVFPQAATQICVVHQIRSCCKYVVYKDMKAFTADMKEIYSASNRDLAAAALDTFEEIWGKKYLYAVRSWRNNWDDLTTFFEYLIKFRPIIYTTNLIENLNSKIRKYTKAKLSYPNDDASNKSVYLVISEIDKKYTQPVRNWGIDVTNIFGDRILV